MNKQPDEHEVDRQIQAWSGSWDIHTLMSHREHLQLKKLQDDVDKLKKLHPVVWWTLSVAIVACIAGIIAAIIAWFAWQGPVPPVIHPPTATEVFELRSKCAMLGEKILENNIVGSNFRQSQVSHYDPKISRCFVQLTVQSAGLSKPPDKLDRYLYDGQTAEMLAVANIEKGVKSGMIFEKGIFGFEEASAYIDERMKDDLIRATP